MNQKQIRKRLCNISYYQGSSINDIMTLVNKLIEDMDGE